jgi:AMP deaminase
MFPGIVSKNARKSSMRSSAVEDGSYPGFRNGEDGVAEAEEQRETDDEE